MSQLSETGSRTGKGWTTAAERLEAKNSFDGSLVFGTQTFNKRTGRDRHLEHRQRNDYFFVDPSTQQLRPEMTSPRSCPSCGGRKYQEIFVKEGFPHLQCEDCHMVYVAPILNEEALLKLYEEEESWTEVLFSQEQMELDKKKFQYGLELIEVYRESGDILDVGCGPGFFLEAARNSGWQVSGIEMNEQCVARLREQGILIHTQPLEEADLTAASCDCVSMWEVLEHLREPRVALTHIHRILRPGGLLLICVPNFGSLVNRILHEKAGTFGGQSHLNFFTDHTLTRMQEAVGFEVAETETIITEFGTINNYLSFEHPYLGSSETVVPNLTPQQIHEYMLGSRLLTLARKV